MSGKAEQAQEEFSKALEISLDSAVFMINMGFISWSLGNLSSAVEYYRKACSLDPSYSVLIYLTAIYMSDNRQYREGFKYFRAYQKKTDSANVDIDIYPNEWHRPGLLCYKNGFRKEGERCFSRMVRANSDIINSDQPGNRKYNSHYDLAAVYAFREDKEKAYANLQIFNQMKFMPLWMCSLIRNDPMFDSIRDEPEFGRIVESVISKYASLHELVGIWIEDKEKLRGDIL